MRVFTNYLSFYAIHSTSCSLCCSNQTSLIEKSVEIADILHPIKLFVNFSSQKIDNACRNDDHRLLIRHSCHDKKAKATKQCRSIMPDVRGVTA